MTAAQAFEPKAEFDEAIPGPVAFPRWGLSVRGLMAEGQEVGAVEQGPPVATSLGILPFDGLCRNNVRLVRIHQGRLSGLQAVNRIYKQGNQVLIERGSAAPAYF